MTALTAPAGLAALDAAEDAHIDAFRRHPVLAGVHALPEDEFVELLIQRRFLSLAFTPAYDLAIDLLRDEEAVRIARVILREEYPDETGHTPSHREDMVEDLVRLGASRQRIDAARPSSDTVATIGRTFELIAEAGEGVARDTGVLAVLRFWGEVLVAVEYDLLWPRMERRLVTADGKNLSLFYFPHKVHDAKRRSLARPSPLASTHSDRLATRLKARLASDAQRRRFTEVEGRAVEVKAGFYDQFVRALPDGSSPGQPGP